MSEEARFVWLPVWLLVGLVGWLVGWKRIDRSTESFAEWKLKHACLQTIRERVDTLCSQLPGSADELVTYITTCQSSTQLECCFCS